MESPANVTHSGETSLAHASPADLRAFQNILVSVDVQQDAHPELARAEQIALYSGASVHIVDVLRDLNMAARMMLPQWQVGHDELAHEKENSLTILAARLASKGIAATSELLRGNYAQQLIQIAESRQVDLLIRNAKGVRSNELGSIGSTSGKLLQRAPCDLWLTQGKHSETCRHIVAAIDATPDDKAHAALNRIILQRSLDLVEREGCDLQIIYVWDVYGAEMIRSRMHPNDFDDMLERNRLAHEESYERTLTEFGLHTRLNNVHMPRGEAVTVIPEFCRARESDLMICGTVARVGLSGMMIGNTANRVLNRMPCSVLAIKPRLT